MDNQFQNNRTQPYNKLIIIGILISIILLLGFALFFISESTYLMLMSLFCNLSIFSGNIALVRIIRTSLILSLINIIIGIVVLIQIKKKIQRGRIMAIAVLALGFFFLIFSLFGVFALIPSGYRVILIPWINDISIEKSQEEIAMLQEVNDRGMNLRKVSSIRKIEMALELYKDDNGFYPQTLIDLHPTTFDDTDILYAYYPAQNPNKYHLGIKISEVATAIAYLDDDADFNSKTAGYINGFNGTDPMYDAIESE